MYSFLSSKQTPQSIQVQLINSYFAAQASIFADMGHLGKSVPSRPLPVPFMESAKMTLLVQTLQKVSLPVTPEAPKYEVTCAVFAVIHVECGLA